MDEARAVPLCHQQLVEAAFADPALASLRATGAPVVVVAQEPLRVVFANRQARALFGGDGVALNRRLLHGAEPGALRIVALTRSLLPDAPPRLERLRFFIGPSAETVTVMCRQTVLGQQRVFAFAVLGARAPAIGPSAVADRPADTSAHPAPQDLVAASPEVELPPSEETQAASGAPSQTPAVSASDTKTPDEPALDDADAILSVTDGGVPVYQREAAGSSDAVDAAPEPDQGEPDKDAFLIDAPADDTEQDEGTAEAASSANVVPLRPQFAARAPDRSQEASGSGARMAELTPGERSAFEEIARALGAQTPDEPRAEEPLSAAANRRARDLIDLVTQFGRSDEPTPPLRSTPQAPSAPARPASPPAITERHASTILDRIPVGVVVSRFAVAIYANRTLLDLLDYADVDSFHAAGGLDRLFHGRAPDNGSTQIETREGELIAVDARVQTIEWDGEPATLVSLRRSQANGEAARAQALELDLRHRDAEVRELHAILDAATDGVAVLDANGRILSLNRSGEALFGYDQNEVAGEHFSTLLAQESREGIAQYFDGLKSGDVNVLHEGREIVGRARLGGSIPVFVKFCRLGGGASPKFCAVLKDLSAWKKAERELGDTRRQAERASALKSDFLAKVSHEIRTPLNAILGFAEVIMDERFGPVGNARYRDYMRDIHQSGEHVLSLVNDLLDLSKIEAGKIDLDFTSVDANAIVGACVSLMQPQAGRERVVIRQSLAPGLPKIVADERSIKQIVLNLLSNAVKFNQPGGQVIVSTALTDAGQAVLRIKDTGLGMTDDELDTALEPFRQVATSRKIEGTGLGLPLTKALVEANRATFSIKSRKNEGTMVEVVFPPTRVLAE
jgi:PAS domain S-box-containing protein